MKNFIGLWWILLMSEWVIARFLSLVGESIDWFSKKPENDLKNSNAKYSWNYFLKQQKNDRDRLPTSLTICLI